MKKLIHQKTGLFGSYKGFGIVEALAAGAIVSISALGLGVSLNKMAQTKSKIHSVTNAMALESSLQTALQEKNSYQAMAADLAKGNANLSSMTLAFNVPVDDHFKSVQVNVGQEVYFDREGGTCTACMNDKSWAYKLKVDGKIVSTSGVPIYAMAYKVDFNSDMTTMAGLGSTGSGSFTDADFKWVIPPSAYMQTTSSSCYTSIDPTDPDTTPKLLVTGINKDTGELQCARFPDTQCAADEVAKSWVVNQSNGHIKLNCQKVPQSAGCPVLAPGGYDYAVQSIDKVSTSTGLGINMDSPHGLCVFTAEYAHPVSAGPIAAGAGRYTGCPAHYHWVGSGGNNGCSFSGATSFQGWRQVPCGVGYTGDRWVQDVNPPALTVSGTIVPGGVDCSLNDMNGSVSSTGGWAANVSMSGSCTLDDTETKPF